MTYKEILDLYKKGQLLEEKKAEVEADIEKQEAISEFLFENDEIPELTDSSLEAEIASDSSNFDEKRFQKMIKKSIRMAFIKLGVAVGVVVLAIVMVANTVMPNIVDAMYYDPTKIVGKTESGAGTDRLSLDTSVYTELFTPGYYRTHAYSAHEGYGKYDIEIFQEFSANGQFRNTHGTIEKGKMTLFDDTIFKLPTQNAFAGDEIKDFISFIGTGAAGDKENAFKKLNTLDDNDHYVAYVTFDKVMSYDEFVAWSEKSGIKPHWGAVCRYQGPEMDTYVSDDILGFNYIGYACETHYDNEKYPYLSFFDVVRTVKNPETDTYSAEVMEQHMISSLRYMKDNKEFRDMAGGVISDDELQMYIDSIEEYGIFTYGFVITAQKDEILEISKNENVNYIYTTPLR